MLYPVIALIGWTFVISFWMYARRLPAIRARKLTSEQMLQPGMKDTLPLDARVVADNYNHLHEQPTIFYALAVTMHLLGAGSAIAIAVAWGYVVLRIVHSLVQIVIKTVPLRFMIFLLCKVCLLILFALTLMHIL